MKPLCVQRPSPQSPRWCDADIVLAVKNRQTLTITLMLHNKCVSVSMEVSIALFFMTALLNLKPKIVKLSC